jgi:hypothetical protein
VRLFIFPFRLTFEKQNSLPLNKGESGYLHPQFLPCRYPDLFFSVITVQLLSFVSQFEGLAAKLPGKAQALFHDLILTT